MSFFLVQVISSPYAKAFFKVSPLFLPGVPKTEIVPLRLSDMPPPGPWAMTMRG